MKTISLSPQSLSLDEKNPRFVVLEDRSQDAIRDYLLRYEDVCQLAEGIDEFGGLLPGERIVAIEEAGKIIVVEGNRRTCALQMLLSPDLVPADFQKGFPVASSEVKKACTQIEVDVIDGRDEAQALMSRRHIEGVKEWRPLAKKQFFANSFDPADASSIAHLSDITGISESTIRADIRDYNLFYNAYRNYRKSHPEFEREIVLLKIDPFWRLFRSKFEFPLGVMNKPKDFFGLDYDAKCNIYSTIDSEAFEKIVMRAFEAAIVEEAITTRQTLSDIKGITPLMGAFESDVQDSENEDKNSHDPDSSPDYSGDDAEESSASKDTNAGAERPTSKGANEGAEHPVGGNPAPVFFETLHWGNLLDGKNDDHLGLLILVNELSGLSREKVKRKKVYECFELATGLVLRAAYEQALILRLKEVGLWSDLCAEVNSPIIGLKAIEKFINSKGRKQLVFPDNAMSQAFDRILKNKQREFLNVNTHSPDRMRVTHQSLETIAAEGMFALIQGIINDLGDNPDA